MSRGTAQELGCDYLVAVDEGDTIHRMPFPIGSDDPTVDKFFVPFYQILASASKTVKFQPSYRPMAMLKTNPSKPYHSTTGDRFKLMPLVLRFMHD